MLSKYLLTVCMLLLPACMRAQTGQFFNPDKQLSSSFVTQVYFDKDGYLWATTRNGINRYDGYQFHVFRKENEQYKTLESNYVNTMLQDRRGLFYFGMYGALQTWDEREDDGCARAGRPLLRELLPGAEERRRARGNIRTGCAEVL